MTNNSPKPRKKGLFKSKNEINDQAISSPKSQQSERAKSYDEE